MPTKKLPAKKSTRAAVADSSEQRSPKTTRPEASQRRTQEQATEQVRAGGRKFDAFPDRIDYRDWVYQPHLVALPDQIVNCDSVPAILDQGQEGACTGFALAAVVNYLLAERNI